MQLVTEDNITDLAVERWATAKDPRLAQIMTAFVRHLHDFAREVRLTEAEWMTAIQWLSRTGQISDEKRQEFILASDVLGLSMLVVQMNHRLDPDATPNTVLGPFHIDGSPPLAFGADMSDGRRRHAAASSTASCATCPARPSAGPCSTCGRPTATACTRRSSTSTKRGCGRSTPRATTAPTACARSRRSATRSRWTGRSASSIGATAISHFRPAHVHVLIDVPGYEPLITHLFQEGAEYLDSDVVFGTKEELVVAFEPQEPGPTPDGGAIDRPVALGGVRLRAATPRRLTRLRGESAFSAGESGISTR